MANPTTANPAFDVPFSGYDPTGNQLGVAPRFNNVQTANGVTYGDLGVQVDVTTGAPTDIVTSGTIAGTTSVTITFGAGVASWTADIGGTIGNGSVLQFEYLVNATWYPAFGVVVGSNSDVSASSVTLASTGVSYQGNAAGFQQFRVRCSSYNGTDNLTIKIVGSVATDGGFVSKSLPPGPNTIGNMTLGDGATPSTKASVGLTHNADNQNLSNVNSVFTAGVASIVSPIGTGNRQLEVGTDGAPSHGITSSTNNLAQTQSSNATGAITQGQTTNAVITPSTMTSGMVANQLVDVDLGTANQEAGYIVSATATTITVQPVNGSPTAPSWKNAHSGTYKIQVRAYNIMRDIKGENSGFDGTGMPPAVEVEWGSGGPPLASGLPSLDQYDRETLIVGQGLQTQAITSTTAGDNQLTMTASVKTLTPGHPIQLSGSGTIETVYVDQSYVLGNNTVIALKHSVVNTGQTTAKWQIYNPSGPLSNLISLYGEGMEALLLSDLANPGYGTMQQNARSNGAPYQASALEAVGLDNGATLDKWQGKNGAGYIARNTQAVYTLASTVTAGTTQNSGDLAVGPYAELSIDINTTAQAGTSPTIQYFYERKGADGLYYVLWQSAVLTVAANTLSTSIGAGMAYNQSLGLTGRLRWMIGGSATPTYTHSINCYGK